MANVAAITANFEIGHKLKSVQVIDSKSNHFSKPIECNEAIICILRSQQQPPIP